MQVAHSIFLLYKISFNITYTTVHLSFRWLFQRAGSHGTCFGKPCHAPAVAIFFARYHFLWLPTDKRQDFMGHDRHGKHRRLLRVLCQLLLMNKTAADAVSASKVRYRASIKGILYDSNLPPETVRALRSKGHRMFLLEDDVTNAAAIFSDEDRFVYAAVNNRIGGYCDGN